jgi:hypothetical protein
VGQTIPYIRVFFLQQLLVSLVARLINGILLDSTPRFYEVAGPTFIPKCNEGNKNKGAVSALLHVN